MWRCAIKMGVLMERWGWTAIDLVAKDQEGNTGQLVACQQALKRKREASVYKTTERHALKAVFKRARTYCACKACSKYKAKEGNRRDSRQAPSLLLGSAPYEMWKRTQKSKDGMVHKQTITYLGHLQYTRHHPRWRSILSKADELRLLRDIENKH